MGRYPVEIHNNVTIGYTTLNASIQTRLVVFSNKFIRAFIAREQNRKIFNRSQQTTDFSIWCYLPHLHRCILKVFIGFVVFLLFLLLVSLLNAWSNAMARAFSNWPPSMHVAYRRSVQFWNMFKISIRPLELIYTKNIFISFNYRWSETL